MRMNKTWHTKDWVSNRKIKKRSKNNVKWWTIFIECTQCIHLSADIVRIRAHWVRQLNEQLKNYERWWWRWWCADIFNHSLFILFHSQGNLIFLEWNSIGVCPFSFFFHTDLKCCSFFSLSSSSMPKVNKFFRICFFIKIIWKQTCVADSCWFFFLYFRFWCCCYSQFLWKRKQKKKIKNVARRKQFVLLDVNFAVFFLFNFILFCLKVVFFIFCRWFTHIKVIMHQWITTSVNTIALCHLNEMKKKNKNKRRKTKTRNDNRKLTSFFQRNEQINFFFFKQIFSRH